MRGHRHVGRREQPAGLGHPEIVDILRNARAVHAVDGLRDGARRQAEAPRQLAEIEAGIAIEPALGHQPVEAGRHRLVLAGQGLRRELARGRRRARAPQLVVGIAVCLPVPFLGAGHHGCDAEQHQDQGGGGRNHQGRMAPLAPQQIEADGDVCASRGDQREGRQQQRAVGPQRAVEARGDQTVRPQPGQPQQPQSIGQELGDDEEVDRIAPDEMHENEGCGRQKMRPVAERQPRALLAGKVAKGKIGERRDGGRQQRQKRKDRRHTIAPAQADQRGLRRIERDQHDEQVITHQALAPLQQKPQ